MRITASQGTVDRDARCERIGHSLRTDGHPAPADARWLAARKRELVAGTINADTRRSLDAAAPGWDGGVMEDPKWLARAGDVEDFIDFTGRIPAYQGSAGETQLARWLDGERVLLRCMKLSPTRKAVLDATCPGWAEGQDDVGVVFRRRAEAVAAFARLRNRLPAYARRDDATPERELPLARWLTRQRAAAKTGRLPLERLELLDAMVPGWRRV